MTSTRRLRGFTLLEMVVTIALVSLLASVAVTGYGRILRPAVSPDEWSQRVRRARRDAILLGHPVILRHADAPDEPPVLFLPDGRTVDLSGGSLATAAGS